MAASKSPIEGRQVAVYTTAEKTDHRIAATGSVTFKEMGQPLETQVCVFVDPTKTYQTMLGIGGAITDASAETFAKMPKDKQQEILNAINRSKKRQAELIITTQKDAVRFPKIDRRDLPFYFMRVEIQIVNGANDFQDCVRKICFR